MKTISPLLMLTFILAIACHKKDDNNTPPVVNDSVLYKVSTVMDVEPEVGGMAIADDGTIFYGAGNKVYKIKDSVKSLIAGGDAGYKDGPGLSAQFNVVGRMAVDNNNNLYLVDRTNNRIRKIDNSGTVSTVVFSYSYPVIDRYGDTVEIVHDTISKAESVIDLNIKNNLLYVACYPGGRLVDFNFAVCRLDSVNFVARNYQVIAGFSRSIDVTQDGKYMYFDVYKLDVVAEEVSATKLNDVNFINFSLGEQDSVLYLPRFDTCIIVRTSLATGNATLIAGQKTTLPVNVPHASVDGVGTNASFNHINLIKRKDKYLYISEADYPSGTGAKIRKMRVP